MSREGLFEKFLPYTWIAVGAVVLQLCWVGASRYLDNQRMVRSAKSRGLPTAYQAPPEAEGPGVRILQFYASARQLTRGEDALICYGVQHAASVRMEPPVEELDMAKNRCFSVTPKQTTTYKLTVRGEDGAKVSQSLSIQVSPPPPEIVMLATSQKNITRGESFTFCYGVKNAESARLEPLHWPLQPVEKNCVKMFPQMTTTFTLVAKGAGDRTEKAKFTVKVK